MVEHIQHALLLSCGVGFILTVWFKTDAFTEYFWFLSTCKNYHLFKKNTGLHYTDFILFNKTTFLRRLVTCHYCLGFWLVLPCIYVVPWIYLPVIYMFSLILYKRV